MTDDEKLKLIQKYIQDRQGWSDQNIADEYKSVSKPDSRIRQIEESSPIDPNDYSDYSTKRLHTPEKQALIDKLNEERFLKIQQAESALKERGYEKYRKRGTKGSFTADSFGFKNPASGKTLRALGPIGTLLGAGLALDSGDASAAIPILDQADSVGESSEDEAQMLAEIDALKSYDKSPARLHRLKALLNKGK